MVICEKNQVEGIRNDSGLLKVWCSEATYLKKIMIFRVIGLLALISYMVVILFTWILANMEGYVYFSAGEPIVPVKYLEWVLGFIGIVVAIHYLREELKERLIHNVSNGKL